MAFPLVGAAAAGMAHVIARYIVPFVVVRFFVAMGLTVAVYIGFDTLSDELVQAVHTQMGAISSDAIGWLSAFGILDGMEILLSAHVAGLALRYTAGQLKRIKLI